MSLLTCRRRGVGKSSPYDAEVEYLESTGTQYIDTLFLPNNNTRIIATLSFGSMSGWEVIFGTRYASGSREYSLQSFNGTGRVRICYGSTASSGAVNVGTNNKVNIDFNKNKLTAGSASETTTAQTFTAARTLFLFALHESDNSTSNRCYKGRIWALKIYDNGVLIRDYIPVRKGQVGYMYDKVSNQLFGNGGTGNFILGSDK